MREYTNSEMNHLIDEHIHNAKHRKILKAVYIDGYTHESIAEMVDLTPRRVSAIISDCTQILTTYL